MMQQMMQRSKFFQPRHWIYLISPLILGGILTWLNVIWLPVALALVILAYRLCMKDFQQRVAGVSDFLDTMMQNIERNNHHIIANMQVGLAVFSAENRLQWRNYKFNEIANKEQMSGQPMEALLPLSDASFEIFATHETTGQRLIINNRIYQLETRRMLDQDKEQKQGQTPDLEGIALYLYDITELEGLKQLYEDRQLALVYARFDNYEEVSRSLTETGLATLNGAVTGMLNKWATRHHGFIVRMDREFALIGFRHQDLKDILKEKFDILNRIHTINAGGRTSPTFSFGIATEAKDLTELLNTAADALDTALNRGGDQAVVNQKGHLSFYGATGTVTAKANRVRARIVSKAIREQMEAADNIIIMGHTKGDFDSIGASVGVAAMARFLKKDVYIAADTLEGELSRFRQGCRKQGIAAADNPYEKITITDKNKLWNLVNANTLLILIDHHRLALSAVPDLVDACLKKIVIDHHRRSEDIIQNLQLLYQEPSSSSTSEMVTELISYFDNDMELSTLEATALYNGILLDSKKFSLQTSERTFEAAAMLRTAGANLQIADELFADSFEDLRNRSKLLTEAKMLTGGFVLSTWHGAEKNSRTSVLAAQAADELSNTKEVSAACVMTVYTDGSINLSARSNNAKFNVQTLMEALGGGGHQSMAAAQFTNKTPAEVEKMLLDEVKKQTEEQK